MNAIDLVAILSFVGLVIAWAFLPANGFRSGSEKEESAAVDLTPVHEGECSVPQLIEEPPVSPAPHSSP